MVNIKKSNIWRILLILIITNCMFSTLTSIRRTSDLFSLNALINLGGYKSFFPGVTILVVFFLLLSQFSRFHLDKKIRSFFIIGLLFSITPIVSSILGTQPVLEPRIIIFPLFFLTFFLFPSPTQASLAKFIINIAVFYSVSSIFLYFIIPEWIVQTNYSIGWIKFLDSRMYGLSGHPNNLASFLTLALIYTLRYRNNIKYPKRILYLILFLAIIIWTQSKTSWFVGILCVSIYFFLEYINDKKLIFRLNSYLSITYLLFIMLFSGFIFFDAISGFISNLLGASSVNRLLTLTGRVNIWEVTINEANKNFIFGYGPSLFSEIELFYSALGFAPSHAHNQYFQSLGETGVLGLFLLIIYMCNITIITFKSGKEFPLYFTILFFFIARSFTQSIFRSGLDEIFFMHMLLVISMIIIKNTSKNTSNYKN